MKLPSILFGILLLCSQFLSAQKQLENIEKKIHTAYSESVQSKTDQFESVYKTLNGVGTKENSDVSYWIAFSKYQQARFYNRFDTKKKAFKLLKEGIQELKSIKKPNSEVLVLQGTMLSFSIAFQRNIAAIISGKAHALYDKALYKNKNNLRTYLAIGKSDYFKPVQYGGGFKAESYLKKALSKPDNSTDASFAPTWGRELVYYYLASFLLREDRIEEANSYCNQGLKKFPNSDVLKSLLDKINGK